jgi:hypothetical protein
MYSPRSSELKECIGESSLYITRCTPKAKQRREEKTTCHRRCLSSQSQAHPVLSEKIEPVCPASAVMKLSGKMMENVVDKDEDKQKGNK